MQTTKDEKLIKNFLEGDDAAFEHLVTKYLRPIYNFLYRLIGETAALDDLTQETFIKTWKNIHRFDRSKNFRIWLFAIAKNTAYDFLRKKKTIPFSYYANAEGNNKLERIPDSGLSPSELAERKDSVLEWQKILREIPIHHRAILLLRYKQNFSLKEISVIMDKPYNTIKSRHNRILKHLKKNPLLI